MSNELLTQPVLPVLIENEIFALLQRMNLLSFLREPPEKPALDGCQTVEVRNVEKGDNLTSIARSILKERGVEEPSQSEIRKVVREIVDINDISNPNRIMIGSKLFMPDASFFKDNFQPKDEGCEKAEMDIESMLLKHALDDIFGHHFSYEKPIEEGLIEPA